MVELSVSRFIAVILLRLPHLKPGVCPALQGDFYCGQDQRIFVEWKAERKRCTEDYHKRYDDWVDECKKLT